jgi:hypothetical protein
MKKISETMAFKVAYCHGVDKQVENLIYNEGCTPEEALKRVNIHLTDEECEELIENELLNID